MSFLYSAISDIKNRISFSYCSVFCTALSPVSESPAESASVFCAAVRWFGHSPAAPQPVLYRIRQIWYHKKFFSSNISSADCPEIRPRRFFGLRHRREQSQCRHKGRQDVQYSFPHKYILLDCFFGITSFPFCYSQASTQLCFIINIIPMKEKWQYAFCLTAGKNRSVHLQK